MLQLQLTARQSASDPDLLLIDDTTPPYNASLAPGGWGAPNLARAALSFVVFRLTSPAGHRLYTAPIRWVSGTYKLFAVSFKAVSEQWPGQSCDCRCDCHGSCSGLGVFSFQDGQYELSYEVWATSHIPAQTASYHLSIPLCDDEQVWALRNGSWSFIGDAGSINDAGNWEWAYFDTTDEFTTYETRRYCPEPGYFTIGQTGVVERALGPSPTQPEGTAAAPALIASTSIRILLSQRIARRLAVATKALLTVAGSYKPPFSTYTPADNLLELFTAQQLLDSVTGSGETDSQTLGYAVADIDQRIRYLESQVSYRQ